jgi:hypothetical protein
MRARKMMVEFRNIFLCLMISVLLLPANNFANAETIAMAIKEGNEILSLQEKSVCLLILRTENQFKPEWPPEVHNLELIHQDTNKKIHVAVQSRNFGSLLKKGFKDAFTLNKNTSSWEGLVSFHLPAGQYRLTAVRGGCTRSIGIGAAIATLIQGEISRD